MEAFASIVPLVIAMFVYAGFTAVTEKLWTRSSNSCCRRASPGTQRPQLITARTGHGRKPEAFVAEIIEALLRSRGRSSGYGS